MVFGLFSGNSEERDPFNYKSKSHLDLIQKHTNQFKKSLEALQEVDKHILYGLSFGTAGWIGSYIFPLVTISIAGYCYATYNFAKRDEYYREYKKELSELISVYKWCMSKESGDHWYKLAIPEIQNLISTLGPWVTSETIHTWSEDDLKPGRLQSIVSGSRSDIPDSFKNELAQFESGAQTAQWAYKLYGDGAIENVVNVLKANLSAKATELVAKFTFNHNKSS